jgi:hypothetical protein
MIERAGALLAFALWAANPARADNVPQDVPRAVDPEITVRAFARAGKISILGELAGGWQSDSRSSRSLLAGAYAQPWPNLKLGAFYGLQYGQRHDEDWVKTDVWHWQDVSGRGEHLLVLDASPRAELSFLPGENWVGELKTRFAFNFTQGQQTLRLRPGLTYFWLRDGQAFLNFFAQYEIYLPVNYGTRTIYETWAYLGALYHLSSRVQVGGYGALKTQVWGNTPAFTATTGRTFLVEADSTVVGLLAVFQFELGSNSL